MKTRRFYDDLSQYYDLIYVDWEESMARQGRALAHILKSEYPGERDEGLRILDAAAGIGTQALPLAQAGNGLVARDLSPGSIARLSAEAEGRGLVIDAAPADMRNVANTVEGRFHVVMAMDNSIPHLLSDEEVLSVLRGFRELLVQGGRVLLSVRDYDKVDRSPVSTHHYGERRRGDRVFRLGQRWEWTGPHHYSTTFFVEEQKEGGWRTVVSTTAPYYAIPIHTLERLMWEAGFEARQVRDHGFFQPVLVGRRGE